MPEVTPGAFVPNTGGFSNPSDHVGATLPAGRPSRKLPTPFQRPSISVGGGVVKREWRWVEAWQIAEGDNVPGVGLISETGTDSAGWVDIRGVFGEYLEYTKAELVWCFTAAK